MKKNLLYLMLNLVAGTMWAQALETGHVELPDFRTYQSKTFYSTQDDTYLTSVSAGYIHYRAADGTFKDIDTNLRPDEEGSYGISEGLYKIRFQNRNDEYAAVLEIPRPVHEKFRGPAQPRPPAMQLRWQLLSFGYFDRLSYVYQILQNARATTPFVSENEINFPQIFEGITARYTCGTSQLKEEFAISQLAREALPDPAQFQLSAEHTYLVFAAEFSIFPGNVNALAHTSGGRKPIKTGNRFAYDGESRIDFEYDADDLYCFFPPDFAWAVNNEEEDRTPVRRIVYSERGKNYLLIGVPWRWVREATPGPLIIDPTTNLTASDDTYLYGASNINNSQLFVGKYQCTDKKRALVKFNVCGVGIPTNATILNAQMKLWYYDSEAGTACESAVGPPKMMMMTTDHWIQAHRVLKPWNEAQATRDVRLTGVNWGAPYGAINGTDALATMESTVQVKQSETGTWKSWTLTNAVQFWLADPNNNYGVILWTPDENVDGYDMRFRSSEHTNKPKLDVIWSNQPKTVYFLKDHLGSVRATVDQTGAVVGYDDFDPWGYILEGRTQPTEWSATQGVTENKFTGNVFDDDFGLNWGYHVDRFYDSEVGRWWSVDPIDQYSLSPYVYGANNPVVIIDPFGADTMYVEWPDGRRTAHYMPDNVVEASLPASGALASPILDVDDIAGVGKLIAKGLFRASSFAAMAVLVRSTAKKASKPLIKLTQHGLAHIAERHTYNSLTKFAKKSKFFQNTSIPTLVQNANKVNPVPQPNGRLAWVVDAGKDIGIDRATNQSTRIYTVITEGSGELVTAYPGLP